MHDIAIDGTGIIYFQIYVLYLLAVTYVYMPYSIQLHPAIPGPYVI